MISSYTLSRALYNEIKEVKMCLACNLEENIKSTHIFGANTPLRGATYFADISRLKIVNYSYKYLNIWRKEKYPDAKR